jgi:pimeloyl-ACP methyl ester carboxylesterase
MPGAWARLHLTSMPGLGETSFAATQVPGLDRTGRFAGHVNVARTVYLGHSFGGAASLEACRTAPHCAGAVDLGAHSTARSSTPGSTNR